MLTSPPQTRYRCRVCGAVLPAWYPVPGEPNGAMLLHHLSQSHPTEVGRYLARMHRDDDIAIVAAEAFEVVEAEPRRPGRVHLRRAP